MSELRASPSAESLFRGNPKAVWGWALYDFANSAYTTLIVTFIGALADGGGHRKAFLATSTLVCIVGIALLYFARPGQVLLALTLFVISNVAYELCGVFYNSYLPDISPPEKIGRISGYGWQLGYVGGLLAMISPWPASSSPSNPGSGSRRMSSRICAPSPSWWPSGSRCSASRCSRG